MSNKDGRIPLNTDALKHYRKQLGLSQEKVAQQCIEKGLVVSISSIKRAESGLNVLYRTAANLAAFYQQPLENLLIDTPNATVEKLNESSPRSIAPLLCLVIETANPELQNTVLSLLNAQHTHYAHSGHYVILGWCSSASDEYVFERIRQLCSSLQATLADQMRCYVEAIAQDKLGDILPQLANDAQNQALSQSSSVRHEHLGTGLKPLLFTARMRSIIEQIKWGDIVACPCFISSDCTRLLHPFLSELIEFAHWYVVSMCQVDTDHFVGRERELTQLTQVMEHWRHTQQGSAVCLSGMAGFGKTRLLQKGIEHARNWTCDTTEIQLLNHGQANQMGALAVLTRTLAGFSVHNTDGQIREQISLSAIPSPSHLFLYWMMDVQLTDSEKQLFDLIEFVTVKTALEHAIKDLCQFRETLPPCLIAIEDLHWADDALMTVLTALLEYLPQTNLLLLLTFRQQNRLSTPQSWFRYVALVELLPLSEEESYQLAHYLLADSPDSIAQCVDVAQGHPLYLRQTLLCSRIDTTVPESLEHLVITQLSQLSPVDRFALKTASVFGQCFSLEQLRHVIEITDFDPSALINIGLIKNSNHQLMFHHDLICSAVHQQLSSQERITINQRSASWFENRDKFQYAIHTHLAMPADAFDVLLNVSQHYLDNFQLDKASLLLEKALDIAPNSRLALAHNQLGNCLYAMGKVEQSLHQLKQAIEKPSSDHELCRYLLDLVKLYRLTDELSQVERLLERAQQLSEQHHFYDLLCEIHSMRGNSLFPTGKLNACEEQHQLALHYATQIDCHQAIAKSLGGLGDCAYAQGRMTSAYQSLQQCLTLCKQHGLLAIETSNRYMLATVLIYQLGSNQALQQAQQASNLAYLTANRRAEIVSRLTAGWIFLERQALPQAANEIDSALTLAEQLGAYRFIAFLLESRARLHWYQGDQRQAEQDIRSALTLVEQHKMHNFIGPWLCATQALVTKDKQQVLAALEQGELWLENSCVGHNYLRFYQQGIEVGWQIKRPDLIVRYRDALSAFCQPEPHPWSEFYIEQANLMLSLLKQQSTVTDLLLFNQKAVDCHLHHAQIDITTLDQFVL